MFQSCKLCNGEGYFGPWGPCKQTSIHSPEPCVLCNGTGKLPSQNQYLQCDRCEGKGCLNAWGKGCYKRATNMKDQCSACQGQGYHCQAPTQPQIQAPGFNAQIGFPQGPQLNFNFQDGYQAPQTNASYPAYPQGYQSPQTNASYPAYPPGNPAPQLNASYPAYPQGYPQPQTNANSYPAYPQGYPQPQRAPQPPRQPPSAEINCIIS